MPPSLQGHRKYGVFLAIVVLFGTFLVALELKLVLRQPEGQEPPPQQLGGRVSCRYNDDSQRHLLTIVTGFSSNHLVEGVDMFQSLIDVNYTGRILVYFMHKPNEAIHKNFRSLQAQLHKSPLNVQQVVPYEVHEEYVTYCFKPKIFADALLHMQMTASLPKVVMWTDSSGRFGSNPDVEASNMIRDDIGYAGRIGTLGMGENTAEETYKYFNFSREKFKHYREVHASTFKINLMNANAVTNVLQKWIHCGGRACIQCMAPSGSSKTIKGQRKGPGSTVVVTHRQDQSVLSLLVFNWRDNMKGKVVLNNATYHNVTTYRGKTADKVVKLYPSPNSENHVSKKIFATFQDLLYDFIATEKRWKERKSAPLAHEIAIKYDLTRTPSPILCMANNTTPLGWIPCTKCTAFRAESGRIPRFIFQSWKTRDIQPNMCQISTQWSQVNPEYDYFLFDDNSVDKFIKLEYGDKIYSAYKCVGTGAAKCDVWRLLVIYLHGGIYFDFDSSPKPQHPFRTWKFGNHSTITGRGCDNKKDLFPYGCPHQWGLIYTPFHPVLRDAIVETLKNLASRTAKHVYNVSYWSYLYAWTQGPYNQSLMPGWGDMMGFRVNFKDPKAADEMRTNESHWLTQRDAAIWQPGCFRDVTKKT